MKILSDTHIFLWLAVSVERISKNDPDYEAAFQRYLPIHFLLLWYNLIMMKTDRILAILRDINTTMEKEGIKLEGVFGSYARSEAEDFSDIDILYSTDPVRFFPDDGFAKAIYLQNLKKRLEGIFRRPVDLIPKKQEQSAFYANIHREFRSV